MDLHISPMAIVVLIQRGDDIFVPNGMTVLKQGDRVLLYLKAPNDERILHMFIKQEKD